MNDQEKREVERAISRRSSKKSIAVCAFALFCVMAALILLSYLMQLRSSASADQLAVPGFSETESQSTDVPQLER